MDSKASPEYYDKFLNRLSRNRKATITREMRDLSINSKEKVIELYIGAPNPKTFPFEAMSMQTRDGEEIRISGPKIETALQYQATNGNPGLVRTLKDFSEQIHGLNQDFWETHAIQVTNGSQDGLCKSIEMLLDFGNTILIPDYVYSGFLFTTKPYEPNFVRIETDENGLKPESLKESLEARWKPEDFGRAPDYPKLLYVNTSAANPTGVNTPRARVEEIYKICALYDILILEDDPYYFLQYDNKGSKASFVAVDTKGIVLRFDSFSKVLSAGMRLGFVTGPKPLVHRINLHSMISVVHASSIAQVMANELLCKWGYQGLLSHAEKVSTFYREQRDFALSMAEKYLTGLCTWNIPQGGMFLWLKVLGLKSTYDMLMVRAVEKKVLLLPGNQFTPDQTVPCPYARISFSLASREDIESGMCCFAELIKEEIELESRDKSA